MSSISNKEAIFRWLYRKEFESGIIQFEDILFEAVKIALLKSDLEAESFVAARLQTYWNWFIESCEDDKRQGLSPTFITRDDLAKRVEWYPSVLNASESKKEWHRRILLRSRPYLLKEIDLVSDREYEALGCVACRAMKAENVKLTPTGSEKGIDFLAMVPFPSSSHIFLR